VCAKVSAVLGAVEADFFFHCWNLEMLLITEFGIYQGAFAIMRKVFDWKCSRISTLDVEAAPRVVFRTSRLA
jgi:hypothetical protein